MFSNVSFIVRRYLGVMGFILSTVFSSSFFEGPSEYKNVQVIFDRASVKPLVPKKNNEKFEKSFLIKSKP